MIKDTGNSRLATDGVSGHDAEIDAIGVLFAPPS